MKGLEILFIVSKNKELSLLNISTNCLAKFFLEIGHNLTPEPPDNITGLAFI